MTVAIFHPVKILQSSRPLKLYWSNLCYNLESLFNKHIVSTHFYVVRKLERIYYSKDMIAFLL